MQKPIPVSSQCLAIVVGRNEGKPSGNGAKLFAEFVEENRGSFWNPGLVESVAAIELVGFMQPGTLLVSGSELHLECLRGAWARRILKAPRGYSIVSLGDIGGIEMHTVPQTQFISLPDTLCLIISGLNRGGRPATLSSINRSLREQYAGMNLPNNELLYGTLAALMSEGKAYCMGEHYFVSTPLMYQHYQAFKPGFTQPTPPNPYNPAWNNNRHATMELPKQDLCSRECQTGASIVNAVPAYKPPSANKRDQASSAHRSQEVPSEDPAKERRTEKEKGGFFKRLFRRSKSREGKGKQREAGKATNDTRSSPAAQHSPTLPPPPPQDTLATFSAQFPPTEWLPSLKYPPQQHGLFKQKRSREKKPAEENQHRNALWLDLDGPLRSKRSSRHYGTVPENLSGRTGGSPRPERRSKNRHRLSKYLSSSSECLHCPLPTYNQELIPRRVKAERRHGRHKREGNLGEDLGKFPVSEPYQDLKEEQHSAKSSPRPEAPLAPPTEVELSTTAATHEEEEAPLIAEEKTRAGRGTSDSALSASPVVTEMSAASSGGSNKYSSWSGSEGRHADVLKAAADPLDHTYINLRNLPSTKLEERLPSPIHFSDPTYENIARHLESTQFENMTLEDESMLDDNRNPVPEKFPGAKTKEHYVSAL